MTSAPEAVQLGGGVALGGRAHGRQQHGVGGNEGEAAVFALQLGVVFIEYVAAHFGEMPVSSTPLAPPPATTKCR